MSDGGLDFSALCKKAWLRGPGPIPQTARPSLTLDILVNMQTDMIGKVLTGLLLSNAQDRTKGYYHVHTLALTSDPETLCQYLSISTLP